MGRALPRARASLFNVLGIVILELGANDGLRGLPLDEVRANLVAMIDAAQKGGSRVLLLGMRIPPELRRDLLERFHAIYGELA